MSCGKWQLSRQAGIQAYRHTGRHAGRHTTCKQLASRHTYRQAGKTEKNMKFSWRNVNEEE